MFYEIEFETFRTYRIHMPYDDDHVDGVSERRPLTALLFIPQVIYEHGELS
jgi:hypothetical protein